MKTPEPIAPPGAVLAVCGPPGTDTSAAVQDLRSRMEADGLSVAVVPRNVELSGAIAARLRQHDVVLVDGHAESSLPRVWIQSGDGDDAPRSAGPILYVVRDGTDRFATWERVTREWLPSAWRTAPVHGGVLIGGKSSRMGRPKQLLDWGGQSVLKHVAGRLSSRVTRIAVLGDGETPPDADSLERFPDAPGFAGPLAGILGALRAVPDGPWIVVGCDQPRVSAAALDWLLEQRAPGTWAVLPRGDRGPEPLLALYDPRIGDALEAMAKAGEWAPSRLAGQPRVATPEIPAELRPAWQGFNTRDEYDALRRQPE